MEYVKMCNYVHANWLKGGTAVGGAYCEMVHNFHMDLQKDSRYIVWVNSYKGLSRGNGI